MVTVVNNAITLVRGDTVEIPVTIYYRAPSGALFSCEPMEGKKIGACI